MSGPAVSGGGFSLSFASGTPVIMGLEREKINLSARAGDDDDTLSL